MTALAIFSGGAPKGYGVSQTILVPGVGSLEYNYTIDYISGGTPGQDPQTDLWDEITLVGSAQIIVDLPGYEANHTLAIDFDATGFNDAGDDGRIVLNGQSTVTGSATWTSPRTSATAGYTVNLTKSWNAVDMDDPSELLWSGYPASGTVVISGSIDRYRDGPSGLRTGSWSGTITITFDGDSVVPVDVNGAGYLLNLVTGEVTAAT